MATLTTRIQQQYYAPQASLSGWLIGLEKMYGLAVWFHQALYRYKILPIHRLQVPVISIGNLTTGGTGKTPMVISLARYLEQQGLRVAVLSRGYGATTKTRCNEATSPEYGDEAFLIQQSLQGGRVFVGPNRVYLGKKAITLWQPDVILLDDGFQHRRLYRDLNIMLVDGELGLGNHHLLPAGPLREPIESLKRSDWVIMTKTINPQQIAFIWQSLKSLRLQHPVQLANASFEAVGLWHPVEKALSPLSTLDNQPVVLLSGLAQPKSFESMLARHTQVQINHHFVFPDHHNYTLSDLQPILDSLQIDPKVLLLTTEKDWVKLQSILPTEFQARTRVLKIAPVINWQPIVSPLNLTPRSVAL